MICNLIQTLIMKLFLFLVFTFIVSEKSFAQNNDSINPQINKLFFNLLHTNNISDFILEIQNRKDRFIDTPVARTAAKVFRVNDLTYLSDFFGGIQKVLLVGQESESLNQKIFSISIDISFDKSISKEQAYNYHKQLRKIFNQYYQFERSNKYWAEKGSYLSYGSTQFSSLYPIELQYPRKTSEGYLITYRYNYSK